MSEAQDHAIRVLVVDDEPLARQRLLVLLEGEPDVDVVGTCSNGLEALRAITAARPDLVFLDVQMPDLDGLAVVDALAEDDCPEIVFVTAYNEYMERAFEVHAVDYLRKPYTNARFHSALAHARRRVRARRDGGPGDGAGHAARAGRYVPMLTSLKAERADSRIAVRDRRTGTWHLISREEIDWIESANGSGHVYVHVRKESFLWHRTLSDLEHELAPHGFLRAHRSFIVNGARVRQLKPLQKGEYAMVLADGTMLDTGRRYQAAVEAFLHGR